MAEEQAFPLVAVHFPLQLELAVTLELACLQSLLSAPIFIIVFNLCDHSTSSLCLSQLPSALQHEKLTERLSKECGLLHHITPIHRGHLKVVVLLIKTLSPCSLARFWSLKVVGWVVTNIYRVVTPIRLSVDRVNDRRNNLFSICLLPFLMGIVFCKRTTEPAGISMQEHPLSI